MDNNFILGVAGIGALVTLVVPLIKAFIPNEQHKLRAAISFIVSVLIALLGLAATGQLNNGISVQGVALTILAIVGSAQIIYALLTKELDEKIEKQVEKTLDIKQKKSK